MEYQVIYWNVGQETVDHAVMMPTSPLRIPYIMWFTYGDWRHSMDSTKFKREARRAIRYLGRDTWCVLIEMGKHIYMMVWWEVK